MTTTKKASKASKASKTAEIAQRIAEKAVADMDMRAAAREASYDYSKMRSMLRDLRIRAKISLPELSEKTGFSAAYLYKVECAKDSEIRLSTLIIILDAMEYDLEIRPRKVTKR